MLQEEVVETLLLLLLVVSVLEMEDKEMRTVSVILQKQCNFTEEVQFHRANFTEEVRFHKSGAISL